MDSQLEQPSPFTTAQKLTMDALLVRPSQRAPSASPYSHSATRSLSLPTPSPSPSLCSEASSTSSSNMLSFEPHSDILDPILRRFQHLSVSPKPPSPGPHLYMSSKSQRHRPQPVFCPTPPNQYLPRLDATIDLRHELDMEQSQFGAGSLSGMGQRIYEEFKRTKSRVVRVSFHFFVFPPFHTTYCALMPRDVLPFIFLLRRRTVIPSSDACVERLQSVSHCVSLWLHVRVSRVAITLFFHSRIHLTQAD